MQNNEGNSLSLYLPLPFAHLTVGGMLNSYATWYLEAYIVLTKIGWERPSLGQKQ